MTCPVCGGKSYVHNSRSDGETVRRYRKCRECGHHFTTEEIDADLLAGHQKKLDQARAELSKEREKLTKDREKLTKDREAARKKLSAIKNLIEQAINQFN